jgi:hypothetical protein
MKKFYLLGAILIFMLACSSVNIVSQFQSTPTPLPTSTPFPTPLPTNTPLPTPTLIPNLTAPDIEGTVWDGTDNEGLFICEFQAGNVLTYQTPNGTYSNGTWHQFGNSVYIEMNDHYAELLAYIDGDVMNGTAWNVNGVEWIWTVTKRP